MPSPTAWISRMHRPPRLGDDIVGASHRIASLLATSSTSSQSEAAVNPHGEQQTQYMRPPPSQPLLDSHKRYTKTTMASATSFSTCRSDDNSSNGGGFLPSPALSTTTTTTTSTASSLLPQPRSHPLRPGSAKEATVINYIDTTLLRIARRHAKKFSGAFANPSLPESERGYESFQEIARDLEAVVDVLWVSGTPSLQIPYLISLAVQVNSYLAEYPFSAAATFRLLGKLDEVFAGLLGDGEGRGGVVSMTEKVRIKSIAESGRVVVVEVREKEREDGVELDGDQDKDEEDEDEDEDEDEMEDVLGIEEYPTPGKWEMETARVYERTIQLLGDELGQVGEFCDDDMAAGEGEAEAICDGGSLGLEDEDENET